MPAKRDDPETDSSTCPCSNSSNKELVQLENKCPVNEIENGKKEILLEDIQLSDLAKQFERALKRVKELELCHLVEPIETTLCKLKQLDEITETLACHFFDANSCVDDCCDDLDLLSAPKSSDQRFFDAECIAPTTPLTKTTCCSKKPRRKRTKTKPPCCVKNNDEVGKEWDESSQSCACESCHCASQGSLSSCPDLPPYDDADDEEEPTSKDKPKIRDKRKREDKCELPCGCDGKRSRSLGCRLATRLRTVDVTSGFELKTDARGKSVAVNRTRSLRTDTTYQQVAVDEAVSCHLPASRSSGSRSSSLAEYESEGSGSSAGDGIDTRGGGAGCRAHLKDRFRRPPRESLNAACESAKGDQSLRQNRGGGCCGCGRRSTNCENEAQLTCPCGCGDLMTLPRQSCDRRCENCGKEILDALEAEFYAEIKSQGLLNDCGAQDLSREPCQQTTFPGEDKLPPIFHTDIKSYIESLEDKCKEKDKIIKELKQMIEEK